MKRRDFLILAGATAVFPRIAFAQAKVPRVVWLSLPVDPGFVQALKDGLADKGYVEGKSVVVETQSVPTGGDIPAYVSRVTATKPDVIVSYGTPGSIALKAATTTIPIVFSVSDPIGAGLVTNFAHPDSNFTGVSVVSLELIGKQVAMIKEIVPTLSRLGVILFPADPLTDLFTAPIKSAASAAGVEPVFGNFIEGIDYVAQFRQLAAANVQAAFQPAFTELSSARDVLFDLYAGTNMPALTAGAVVRTAATPFPTVVAYAPDQIGMIRTRVASMVDEILKGRKPADIPVEEPTIFDLGVNLDMAKKIGVTIPPDILAQATLVIDYDIPAAKAGAK